MTICSGKYERHPSYTVADILTGTPPIDLIMVRTNDHNGGDMLFGYCQWDGKRLIPLDGDDYRMDECVMKYEYPSCGPVNLIYWVHSDWIAEEET